MSTPYLDEAERCSRVALMNKGQLMLVDTPANVKKAMKGEVLEIVCHPVRDGFKALKQLPVVREVQAFGDRLNVIVDHASTDAESVLSTLRQAAIHIDSWRVISPSLENVFISLLTEKRETGVVV